ncbi:MAG TPA: hypothetical protein VH165_34695 [Kofleriaceae bacterium]|jgi:hypothetical protein|nr:hypothetical protein [Kofleriaceae bacterium]
MTRTGLARALAGLALAGAGLVGLAGLGACSKSTHYLAITVSIPAPVYDAATLTITLSNDGTSRMDSFPLAMLDPKQPTFTVSAPDRTGELAIAIDALDAGSLVIGHGTGSAELTADAVTVTLDPTDFVVNTEFAGDQYPTSDFEASGFQLASDGTSWTVGFADGCPTNACSLFGRQFDANGKPLSTALAASANQFTLSTAPTTFESAVAIATQGTTTLAVWDYYDATDTTGTIHGIACRPIGAGGVALADQKTAIATDEADVVSIAGLASGNFVASWKIIATDDAIHAAILKPDCTPLSPTPIVVATATTSTSEVHRAAVASNHDQILFAWIVDGDLHIRTATSAGVLGSDVTLMPKLATQDIEHVRVVADSTTGFVVVARWAESDLNPGPGKLELYHLDATGKMIGMPALVTDQTASDATDLNDDSFGLAIQPGTDTVLVAWHTCGQQGDGSMCGVFGRYLHADGTPYDAQFVIPTTTEGDQQLPSVVGLTSGFVAVWSDGSSITPDISGKAVRARVLQPPPAAGQPAASSSAR